MQKKKAEADEHHVMQWACIQAVKRTLLGDKVTPPELKFPPSIEFLIYFFLTKATAMCDVYLKKKGD